MAETNNVPKGFDLNKRYSPIKTEKEKEHIRNLHKDPEWKEKWEQANTEKAQSEEWLTKVRENAKRLAQDPEWRARVAKMNKDRATPGSEWYEATLEGSARRKAYGEWLRENDPEGFKQYFGYIEQHSKKTKKQMSKSATKRWAEHKRPMVIADGIEYDNFLICAEKLGLHKDTVSYRCKSNTKTWENWYFKNK